MYSRILIAAMIFPLLGSFAQAGVITGIDWDQVSGIAAVQNEHVPAETPIQLDRGEKTENGMSAPSVSSSVSSSNAVLASLGPFAPVSLTGTIVNLDLSPPVPPLLDGIIRPA